MAQISNENMSPSLVLAEFEVLQAKSDWQQIAARARLIPLPLVEHWIHAADIVGFALGQLGNTKAAITVVEETFRVEPSRRRASALAYLHYNALLNMNQNGGDSVDRENHRNEFKKWIKEALSLEPSSIKDLYRLGMFEAQIEHHRDRAALRAFVQALDSFLKLPVHTQKQRGDLKKYFLKSLYAGARSAHRLGELGMARRLIFDCIRFDRETSFIADVFKLFLAGKVCFDLACETASELPESLDDKQKGWKKRSEAWATHAERAFRQALDAKGPPRRDFVYCKLAELSLWQGDHLSATRWIEGYIPSHKRKSSVWRLYGEILTARGEYEQALSALQNALQKDRGGRHLTITAMGKLYVMVGKLRKAEKSFHKAIEFRRRRYASDHTPALIALCEVLESQGRTDEARQFRSGLDDQAFAVPHGPIGAPVSTKPLKNTGDRYEGVKNNTDSTGTDVDR